MDKKARFLQVIRRILLSVELKSTNRRDYSTDSRPKWVKNTLTKAEEHCIMYSVQRFHTEPGLPAVNASDKVKNMFLHNNVLNFYRIEVFLNSDDTMDAFLYWRIPEDSTFRAKNYGGDDRWDLIAAKIDLLADGVTCRELIRRITKCPYYTQHINDQLKFTLISDCPVLDDVAYSDYVDSEKVMDIFFDDGTFSKIRTIMDSSFIKESEIVARFAFF